MLSRVNEPLTYLKIFSLTVTLRPQVLDSLRHFAFLSVETFHLLQFWPRMLCFFNETSIYFHPPERGGVFLLPQGGLCFSSPLWLGHTACPTGLVESWGGTGVDVWFTVCWLHPEVVTEG